MNLTCIFLLPYPVLRCFFPPPSLLLSLALSLSLSRARLLFALMLSCNQTLFRPSFLYHSRFFASSITVLSVRQTQGLLFCGCKNVHQTRKQEQRSFGMPKSDGDCRVARGGDEKKTRGSIRTLIRSQPATLFIEGGRERVHFRFFSLKVSLWCAR